MVAVYRWGTRDLLLICPAADVRALIPGSWYGRYAVVPLAGPEPDTALGRLIRGTASTARG